MRVPSLREMKESLRDLATLKLNEVSKEIGFAGTPKLEESALKTIENYAWPGNFRELENILYEALIELRLKGEKQITGSQIKRIFNERETSHTSDMDEIIFEEKLVKHKQKDLLKKYYKLALEKYGFNKSKTANMIGISRKELDTALKNCAISIMKK